MKEIHMEKEDAGSPVNNTKLLHIIIVLLVVIIIIIALAVISQVLVTHYTSVGAPTPLTGTLSAITEGGGFVEFSLSLSTPSNITPASDIHLTVSGANILSPTAFTYIPASPTNFYSYPDYWISSSYISSYTPFSSTYYYYAVITFTNPNGLAANSNLAANYVANGAIMNVYIIFSNSNSPTPTISSSGIVSPGTGTYLASGWTMSGISISMTVSGYSGTILATA